MSETLTPKRKLFADEYLKDLNATAAFRRAGYKYTTDKAAATEASRIKADPTVAAYIAERMQEREERTEVTQDRVLKELARIAFFDPRSLFDEAGNLLPIGELNEDAAAVLAAFDVTEMPTSEEAVQTLTKKLKLVDKKGALELTMRHLGMFNDKQTIRHEFADLSDDEIEARIAALSRR